MVILATSGCLLGCGSGTGSAQAQSSPSVPSTKDLSAFLDTYWYVPPSYLPAYQINNHQVTLVNDQTIWHITGTNSGYLTGCSFASTDNGVSWSSSTLVGSVTADNAVSLGFYGTTLVVGQGTLTSAYGQPAFLMQMSAGSSLVGLTHWAYMLPITPQDASWNNLPGTSGKSVTEATAGGC